MKAYRVLVPAFACSMALVLVACDKKEKKKQKGDDLGVTKVEPEVLAATPGALQLGVNTSTGLNLADAITQSTDCSEKPEADQDDCYRERALVRLKERVFNGREGCQGTAPATIKGLHRCALNKIDDRIAEMNTRNQDNLRVCVTEDAKDHEFAYPAEQTRTMKIQCSEKLSSPEGEKDQHLGFGVADKKVYLITTHQGGHSTYATYDKTTKDVEVIMTGFKIITADESKRRDADYTIADESLEGKKAVNLLQVKANKDNKTFELALGSSAVVGTGLGCGVRLKSDGNYIWVKGIFAEPGSTIYQEDCDETHDDYKHDAFELCLNGTSLAVESDTTKCDDLKTFTVADIKPSSFSDGDDAVAIDKSYVDKVTDFNESAPEVEE